ncbi:MAG: hypothetical protein AVDCRST_MAG20-1515, partial [uncultured Acidimicrobiales bacterium]
WSLRRGATSSSARSRSPRSRWSGPSAPPTTSPSACPWTRSRSCSCCSGRSPCCGATGSPSSQPVSPSVPPTSTSVSVTPTGRSSSASPSRCSSRCRAVVATRRGASPPSGSPASWSRTCSTTVRRRISATSVSWRVGSSSCSPCPSSCAADGSRRQRASRPRPTSSGCCWHRSCTTSWPTTSRSSTSRRAWPSTWRARRMRPGPRSPPSRRRAGPRCTSCAPRSTSFVEVRPPPGLRRPASTTSSAWSTACGRAGSTSSSSWTWTTRCRRRSSWSRTGSCRRRSRTSPATGVPPERPSASSTTATSRSRSSTTASGAPARAPAPAPGSPACGSGRLRSVAPSRRDLGQGAGSGSSPGSPWAR